MAILRTKRSIEELGQMLLASFEKHPRPIISHRLRAFALSKVAKRYGQGYSGRASNLSIRKAPLLPGLGAEN
ncbi:hypothetical protein ACLB1E_16860 [Escherichia coli]